MRMKTPELSFSSRMLVDDMDDAVADLSAGPVEQAHAAMRVDQAVFHRSFAGADVLPSCQILAVEKLPPLVGIACAGVVIPFGCKTGCYKTKEQKYRNRYAFQHRNLLHASLLS